MLLLAAAMPLILRAMRSSPPLYQVLSYLMHPHFYLLSKMILNLTNFTPLQTPFSTLP